MQKKFIIAFILTAFLWGGFMFIRHDKKEDSGAEHRRKMNDRITETAKQSPRAGMTHVGQALAAYHKDKNEYPENLIDLYPDYLDNRPLLTEIDWHYERRGNDFYLSKTIISGNRRLVASMDSSMRPKSHKGVMVASPAPPSAPRPTTPAKTGPQDVRLSDETKLAMARENFLRALREEKYSVAAVSEPGEKEATLLTKVVPRFLETDDGMEGHPDLELGGRFLVWKGNNGALGFSNTQYPEMADLSIFTYGRWYHVKKPPEGETDSGATIPQRDGKDWWNTVAAGLGEGCLAWKDEAGRYGFGDAQYPQRKRLRVFNADDWVALDSPPVPADPDADRPRSRAETAEDRPGGAEHLAAEMASQWLVWKEKSGNYGFGDRQYPGTRVASVYQDGGWTTYDHPPASSDSGNGRTRPASSERAPGDPAARIGAGHLIWKDKNGTLGFGNLQYPPRDVASVYHSDEWVDAETLRRPPEIRPGHVEENKDQETAQQTPSFLDGPYLVWKTPDGTLGFGNHQYPAGRGISHMHIDGNWEPVAY